MCGSVWQCAGVCGSVRVCVGEEKGGEKRGETFKASVWEVSGYSGYSGYSMKSFNKRF